MADLTAQTAPFGNDAGQGDQGEQQGFVIEILVKGDGTFTVSSEPADDEENQESANGTQCKSIGDALKAVLDIYKQGGPDTSDSDFNEGYGGNDTSQPVSNMPKGGYQE